MGTEPLISVVIGVLGALTATGLNPLFQRLAERRRARTAAAAEERRLTSVVVSGRTYNQIERAAQPSATSHRRASGPSFYLTHLEISDFRCFESTSLALRYPGESSGLEFPNVNLLLGNNGTGKTSVLKAVCLAALGPILESSGFVPYHLVREQRDSARVRGTFDLGSGNEVIALSGSVKIDRHRDVQQVTATHDEAPWDELYSESSPAFFMAAYGTFRRVAADGRSDGAFEKGRVRRRYLRAATLFGDEATLVPFSSWLPYAPKEHRQEVQYLLDELLPEGTTFTGKYAGPEPLFRRHGTTVPFPALSDGFRSYVGWLGDLLFQLSSVTPSGQSLQWTGGIVLVDEVDLFLHPSWQRVVVPTVAQMLPNLQFIMTTHSPVVAGTLAPENIVVSEEVSAGISEFTRFSEDVHGMTSEQILRSAYFSLPTSRAPSKRADLAEMARAAASGGTKDVEAYVRALSEDIGRDDSERDDLT